MRRIDECSGRRSAFVDHGCLLRFHPTWVSKNANFFAPFFAPTTSPFLLAEALLLVSSSLLASSVPEP